MDKHIPDLDLELVIEPKQYWETYDTLKHNVAIAGILGEKKLEALARMVRELSENAYHYGSMPSTGRFLGFFHIQTFELRISGPAFDSKKKAAESIRGGLHSSDAVLKRAGGLWNYRYESGCNVFTITFYNDPST